jgi:hypothetical protein
MGVRVQVAERPVPSARTLPSPLSCSRTNRIVWSLTLWHRRPGVCEAERGRRVAQDVLTNALRKEPPSQPTKLANQNQT